MSNTYLTFFYIIGYVTITQKTKESILEKEIEANLDSINAIIITISYVIRNSIGYFQTNRNFKDTLGYIKFWSFSPTHTSYKSPQLEESQPWKSVYEEIIKFSVRFVYLHNILYLWRSITKIITNSLQYFIVMDNDCLSVKNQFTANTTAILVLCLTFKIPTTGIIVSMI